MGGGLQHDGAQNLRLVAEMAIDRLLADAGGLADAVDAGALIAVRQELPTADRQQMVEPGGKTVVGADGGLRKGGDGRKSCLRVVRYGIATCLCPK
jgi:hypothetical protein